MTSNGDKVEVLGAGRYLRLVRRANFEFAERVNSTGVVCVAAVTDDGKLLFVEQYREPLQARTIELVAGLAGDLGDEPLVAAARRELEEETGYAAGHWEEIGRGPSSGGMSSSVVHFFHARGLRRVGPGGGVHGEDIVVHETPLGEVYAWLEARGRGALLVDPKVYFGVHAALARHVRV